MLTTRTPADYQAEADATAIRRSLETIEICAMWTALLMAACTIKYLFW